ncbi:hypothetical protein B0F90DRAFT_1699804 [Multifurca ochricompacta]|uniref:F-box domain-containing protein n=1 Tax=Multifurca ochricompacta TaxID=376703 RepID=A0AAD4MAT6_9AGAM|nr:hypothetical protein B0F90DRAFT_1699804 [Multifurca ochricompacta]
MSDICQFGLAEYFTDPLKVDSIPTKPISTSSIILPRPSPGLTSLPDDVLLLVISLIGVEDILTLRMTSKRFSSVTKQRWVWSDVLKHHVIDKRLPVPAFIADLKSLSAKELEVRVIHASRFHRNWSSLQPRSRRNVDFYAREPINEEASSLTLLDVHPHPISQVHFPPGYNGELLITVEESRVACWEIPFEGSEAFLVAERYLNGSVIDGLVVNDDPDNEAMLIVMFSRIVGMPPLFEIKAEVWSLDKFRGSFTTLRSEILARNVQRRMSPVARLCGDLALLGDPVVLWNWKRKGPFFTMSSGNIHHSPTPDSVLAVQLVRNHLLVVRQSHIQLLPTPLFDQSGRAVQGASTFGAFLHVQDPAREAVVIVHEMTEEEREAWQFNPVTILMRVTANDSHTIRKYDLLPRPVASAELGAENEFCNEQDATTRHLRPTDSPCTLPARPTQTIEVPPSCSNLVVGRNGKGFWMATQNMTCEHKTFPVRSFVGFEATSHLIPAQDSQPSQWQNELVLHKNGLYKSRVGSGEVHERKYRILTSCLEDTVGRIAIGGRDGKVHIMDFA